METTTKQGILVMYINVGNLPKNKQKEYLKKTAKTFEELKESCNIEIIYFPLVDPNESTRVDYIKL
jgi:hypothetical protein